MPTGILKWFQAETGVGFIQQQDDEEYVFVMQSALRAPDLRLLEVGEKLEFEIQDGASGPAATDVRRITPQ